MKDGWKKALGVGAFGAVCYMGGYMNGGAPPGAARPTTALLDNLGETAGEVVQTGTRTAQTVVAEAGAVGATAGNAAAAAGNGVQGNTVPGAPPK